MPKKTTNIIDLKRKKKAYLVENCGMPDERVYSGIETIPDQAGYFSILIVKRG